VFECTDYRIMNLLHEILRHTDVFTGGALQPGVKILVQVVQHLSDFCRKLIASERFLDEICSFVQNAVMCYQVGGIARHIKALEVRADGHVPLMVAVILHLFRDN